MEPLISVIVPIYKTEPYLCKCVNSILHQTYKNLEIVLVDDGSPDGCPQICDEYAAMDPRIIVIHKKNGGQAEARNVGLKQATGEYVSFVDSDDWLETDYYDILFGQIMDNDVAICGYNIVDEQGKKAVDCALDKRCIDIRYDSTALKRLVFHPAFGLLWNKLYRASAIRSVEISKLKTREDYLFNLQILTNVKRIRLCGGYTGYNWVQNPSSITHSINATYVEQSILIGEKLSEVLKQSSLQCKQELYDHIMKTLLADTILVGVVGNRGLAKNKKIDALRRLIRTKEIGQKLIYKKEDILYHKLLWFCFKTKSAILLYAVTLIAMKGMKG